MAEGNGIPDGGPTLNKGERSYVRLIIDNYKWRKKSIARLKLLLGWIALSFGALLTTMKVVEMWPLIAR